jgi:hypothetical protein
MKNIYYSSIRPAKAQPTKLDVFKAFLKLTGLFIGLVVLCAGSDIIEALMSNFK